jgi:hypothetical protein
MATSAGRRDRKARRAKGEREEQEHIHNRHKPHQSAIPLQVTSSSALSSISYLITPSTRIRHRQQAQEYRRKRRETI